jgi:hypothetical protein
LAQSAFAYVAARAAGLHSVFRRRRNHPFDDPGSRIPVVSTLLRDAIARAWWTRRYLRRLVVRSQAKAIRVADGCGVVGLFHLVVQCCALRLAR